MIKVICFDLDGVYFTEKGKRGFVDELSRYSSKEIVEDLLFKSSEMRLLSLGLYDENEFLIHLNQTLQTNFTLEELSDLRARNYEVDTRVDQVVNSLLLLGYTLGVCTNNNKIRISALQKKFHFLDKFKIFVSSHECGFFKPSKEVFIKLIQSSGCLPEEIVYTDDREDRLTSAKELGIITHVYNGIDDYLLFLKKNAVDVL